MSGLLITQVLWEVAKAKKNSGVEMQLEVLIRGGKKQEEVYTPVKEAFTSIDANYYFGDVGINPGLGDSRVYEVCLEKVQPLLIQQELFA